MLCVLYLFFNMLRGRNGEGKEEGGEIHTCKVKSPEDNLHRSMDQQYKMS